MARPPKTGDFGPPDSGWRRSVYLVVFESDTRAGRLFDIVLLAAIVVSVTVVMLDSVQAFRVRYGDLFLVIEWAFTVLFTVEYAVRLVCVDRPARYARSFFGVIDLLAIVPTYLSLFFAGSHYLQTIRILRVLRVFRVLKVTRYMSEADILYWALVRSRRKIAIFIFAVLTLVVTLGSLMYIVEGEASGFTSIPKSIYWAIVTLTTVGYGDISPVTPLGQALASVIMITGYGIIAVPTGIVTAELTQAARAQREGHACSACGCPGHDADAKYCKRCGAPLEPLRP